MLKQLNFLDLKKKQTLPLSLHSQFDYIVDLSKIADRNNIRQDYFLKKKNFDIFNLAGKEIADFKAYIKDHAENHVTDAKDSAVDTIAAESSTTEDSTSEDVKDDEDDDDW